MSKDRFRPPRPVEDFAERMNLTNYQVRAGFKRGELRGFKIGNRIMILGEEEDRLLGRDRSSDDDPPAAA
jgi:hypothetical protein